MPIQVGDKIPSQTFRIMTAEGPKPVTSDEIFAGKKILLVGVPGAFTPTCHKNHVPGYVNNADELKSKGVQEIFVLSANDQFVMSAWQKVSDPDNKLTFLADGNQEFSDKIDLTLDGSANGLGKRLRRFSILAENGVVKIINVEQAPGQADMSGASHMLELLA
jgi:glutaredoxin/glutathione-dependent peroxiredoxin